MPYEQRFGFPVCAAMPPVFVIVERYLLQDVPVSVRRARAPRTYVVIE